MLKIKRFFKRLGGNLHMALTHTKGRVGDVRWRRKAESHERRQENRTP